MVVPKWKQSQLKYEERKLLAKLLTDQEKKIIFWRYAFFGDLYGQTFIELAKRFGVTERTIRKIHNRALDKMRDA